MVRPTVDHGRKRSRSLDDDDDEKISTTTTTFLPATAPPTDQQPDHPDDDYDMTWENDQYHSTTTTTVLLLTVKRDDVQICIKGRGYLTNCSPYRRPDDNHHHNDSDKDDDDPFSISIHGYHIPSVVLQSDADDNDDKKKKSTVYFDSARWSSWLTLSLRCGHVLQIASSSSSVVTTTTDPPSRTFDIYKVNHPSMTTTTTTIRPTLIPTSWCRAVHDIVQDYTNTITTTTTRPNDHDDTTTTTVLSNTTTNNNNNNNKSLTAATYQHLSYYQDSVDNDDDDDDDDDEHNPGREVINHDNPCDTTDHPTIQDQGYQIMICGAKGVGKSTCLRYTINSLLNVVSSTSSSTGVMVLDADVGQPEYTTTGMLQLTLVRHANLVPPHLSQLLSARYQNIWPTTTATTILDTNNTHKLHHHHHETDHDPVVVVVAQHYFGSMTSSTDPMSYMQCIESMLRQYQDHIRLHCNRNEPVVPLVINMDGWTKDLGYEILTTLVQDVFQLRHVIQISGNTPSKILDLSDTIQKQNLKRKSCRPNHHIILHQCDAYNIRPRTTAATCASAIGRSMGDTELDDVDDDDDDVEEMVTKKVETAEEKDTTHVPSTSIIPASILRDIRLITYFMQVGTCDDDTNDINDSDHVSAMMMQQASQIWDTIQVSAQGIDDTTYMVGQTLASARPYVISIDAIRIRFTLPETHNDITSDDHIMDIMNGTLVGLCTAPENEHDALETPTVLLPCWGLGLVRAIDRNRRLLFLITPIDANCLQNVNCLTIGSNLHLPVQCYFRGPHSEAFPYLQFARPDSVPILGSDPMKSRNNIHRRGRASGGG